MSSPNQSNIETIIIALLAAQSGLSGVSILAKDTTTNLKDKPDYITVSADDPTPEVDARAPFLGGKIMSSMVQVSIVMSTNNPTTLDAWQLAVEAGLASAPSSVITTATSLFPNGFQVDTVTAVSENEGHANQREHTKTFKVVYLP
jgi:hypothetical protein